MQFLPTAIVTGASSSPLDDFRIDWTGEFVFALGWLVLVLSIGAISLLNLLIRRGSAVNVASLFYLTPPTTALLAWLLFGETLTGRARRHGAGGVRRVSCPAMNAPASSASTPACASPASASSTRSARSSPTSPAAASRRNDKDSLPERIKTLLDGIGEVIAHAIGPSRRRSKRCSSTSIRNRRCCSARRAARRSRRWSRADLPVAEYTALQVKQAVVGHGKAAKEQVQHMVMRLLQLPGEPTADAADALACAICHAHGGQGLGEIATRGFRVQRKGGSSDDRSTSPEP